jgi:hypothetical protein
MYQSMDKNNLFQNLIFWITSCYNGCICCIIYFYDDTDKDKSLCYQHNFVIRL